MDTFNGMMVIFYLAIGVYSIYAAIAGKGYAYKNDYPEEIKEEANKMMRVVLAVAGPILILFAALEYFKIGGYWIVIGGAAAIGVLFIVYAIIFRRKFGKILKKYKRMP